MKNKSILILLFFITACATFKVPPKEKLPISPDNTATRRLYTAMEAFIDDAKKERLIPINARMDSLAYHPEENVIELYMNQAFSYKPYRENEITKLKHKILESAGKQYKNSIVTIYSNGYEVSELVPNYFRSDPATYDPSRMAIPQLFPPPPLIRFPDHPLNPSKGLMGSHIALWHSHGWYYENRLDRWEWQRARVFQIVEDLYPMAYTVPFLAPMLENAGAVVLFPRERDIQTHEVIVDMDSSTGESMISFPKKWAMGTTPGFSIGNPPYKSGENPFQTGQWLYMMSDPLGRDSLKYIPDIPETGKYAIYLSWADTNKAVSDAEYLIQHTGGTTRVLANQTMGYGTWIYAGTYYFEKGLNPECGSVILTNCSFFPNKVITADAVRFGGGMGNVSRNNRLSNRPLFTEGARYYLQYAGFPDTLVYNLNKDTLDYNDDYQCRGAWVNYLGGTFIDSAHQDVKGLQIPIDLSLAFHTDAGSARTDTVIGTLMIYSTKGLKDTLLFPNGVNRIANRDFADILQTQIVEDLSILYDPVWNRRGLWDSKYNEAWKPNVPAGLLELLSHHNFLDMKYGLDPHFRFDVSRSIYKAILKFLAISYNRPYTVQPLPPTDLCVTLQNNGLKITWKGVDDPLEPTASPEYYLLYMRVDEKQFGAPIVCEEPHFILPSVKKNSLYQFKVTAANAGGESFPTVILSAGISEGPDTALVIYNFDRVSAPATLENDPILGFADFLDQGVPWGYDISYVGSQYEFNGDVKWLDDDNPGHGASFATYETSLIAGNTFNYTAVHGQALMNLGYSFASCQTGVLKDTTFSTISYSLIDVLNGEQKTTPSVKAFQNPKYRVWVPELKRTLTNFSKQGGIIFVNGAYIGTDAMNYPEDKEFCEEILKFKWRTNYASKSGAFVPVLTTEEESSVYTYVSELNDSLYAVESPDGIEPANQSTAKTLFRYCDNNISAGILYCGDYSVIALGVPFESLCTSQERDAFLTYVLTHVIENKNKKHLIKNPTSVKL
ncbi:MAG: xanthan lyase [Candidatus Marinimicrobia bacterium]|nr:xanthan lyase [Candidatus Neomarinimicrobiota bacterium]